MMVKEYFLAVLGSHARCSMTCREMRGTYNATEVDIKKQLTITAEIRTVRTHQQVKGTQ